MNNTVVEKDITSFYKFFVINEIVRKCTFLHIIYIGDRQTLPKKYKWFFIKYKGLQSGSCLEVRQKGTLSQAPIEMSKKSMMAPFSIGAILYIQGPL